MILTFNMINWPSEKQHLIKDKLIFDQIVNFDFKLYFGFFVGVGSKPALLNPDSID
jgi:hypothetical protein